MSVTDSAQAPSKRERSTISFPYGDLDSAVKVAQTVHAQGGGHCTLDQLAAWLGYSSVGNGAFRQQVNTSRIFGLSTPSRNNVDLTPLGYRIVDPEQAKGARVEAFLAVPLYRAVHEQFRGRALPPDTGLESAFAELGVARKQTDRARHAFQRSAQQSGFFDAGTGRLVEPSVGPSRPASAEGAGDAPKPATQPPAGTPVAPTDDLHPLIQGLVATLPEPGSAWSDEERQEWLNAAKSNFALIYKRDLKQLPLGEPKPVEQATA
ncbi:MAG: hypothetical protein F4Y92_08575 [Dehalococcoidia bacterium]|nr:hypothetical protein [Dehalococcoidia bacterium]